MLRVLTFLALATLSLNSSSSACYAQRQAVPPQTPANETKLKVLSEGLHSSIIHPFIAVLRDSETYAEVARLDSNLPKLDPDFFKSNIVVAAFLGERNTGGYSVEIKNEAFFSFEMTKAPKTYLRIIERPPERGMMVSQVITSPFKVVSLQVSPTTNVLIATDNAWMQMMKLYRVTGGTFTVSGGFAGTSEQFGLGGNLRIMRERNLATIGFLVVGLHPQNSRSQSRGISLADFATGIVNADGQVTIKMISANSFVNPPNGGLKATGNLSAADGKISLSFNSLPSMIADGYSGAGIIEAILFDSAAKP